MQITQLYVDAQNDNPVLNLWTLIDELWTPITVFAEGGYLSLTGPGETATPGMLEQTGPFTVFDPTGSNAIGFNVLTNSVSSTGFACIINCTAVNSTILLKAASSGGSISLDSLLLGFYGATPITRQAGSGITTVAQLVTFLQLIGLLS